MFKFLFVLLIAIFSVQSIAYDDISKEATLIEVVSSSEVLIEAAGIYESQQKSRRKRRKDVKRNGKHLAIENAKRAAVYYLLFNGTDPLLSDAESIKRFDAIADEVFSDEFIDELVMYVVPTPT